MNRLSDKKTKELSWTIDNLMARLTEEKKQAEKEKKDAENIILDCDTKLENLKEIWEVIQLG